MRVFIDPEELQRFRNELIVLKEDLEEQVRKVEGQITELHETWDDAQFRKFEADFEADKEFIRRPLIEDLELFAVDYLARTQQAAEDYLGNDW